MIQQTEHFISFEDASQIAPAIATEHACPSRSSRYSFVSSSEIFNSMEENDWGLKRIVQSGSRESDPMYRKHEMVFRPRDMETVVDSRYTGHTYLNEAPELFPEIKIINSLDGTTSLRVTMGIFALICANGMTVSVGGLGAFRAKHLNFDPTQAYEIIENFGKHLPIVFNRIEEFGNLEMDREIQVRYAREAAALRYPSGMENPELLLDPRRKEDQGNDLWKVFQRTQENCMKGGQKLNKRKSRPLVELSKASKFNEELWAVTEAYAEVIA